MTIYTKVKGFSSFHRVTCEIIPTGNGYERLAIHSAEPISALHSVGQSQLFNRLHSL